jgi:6-phosphogluconate dehydrogenase
MAKAKCELGMIGLGTMGRNLLLNLVDHGFNAACFDRNPAKAMAFCREEAEGRVEAGTTLRKLAALLKRPRVIMLLVPAGPPVDEVLKKVAPHLAKGDIVIDGGNSHSGLCT